MILSFKTKIDGKPTFFMEKIWASLEKFCDKNNICIDEFHTGLLHNNFDDTIDRNPKIHTIRKDEKNRWKPGMMIDFFINARQKDMFRFAPRIQVVSTQQVLMSNSANGFKVSVDGFLLEQEEIKQLAINDGFDNVEDFQDYFINEADDDMGGVFYKAKILHWTDFKY